MSADALTSLSEPDAGLSIDLLVEAGDWDEASHALALRAAKAAWGACVAGGDDVVELSIVLADDDFVQGLNRKWRQKDKPTNVLSFPAGENTGGTDHLGDIVLAFETISREAVEQKKTMADHFSHLVVHGMLHLMGYDHEDEGEAEDMESLERDILAGLGIADPYAEDLTEN
ncbi:MAG: rRNA maturation RNase YbeY [Rhizobiales bacterium]|nr:rRNA maturation RNase YbeY [Hyphomicrobiales bacterium]